MKKYKNQRQILYLSLFIISFINCLQIIQTINLQQNERYILKLDDYYDFTASSIDFPTGQLAENIKIPYQEMGKQIEGPIISSVASYQESLQSKYFIGYIKGDVNGNCQDIQIIYFHLEMIQGVLTRTLLDKFTLSSTCDKDAILSASFYSSTNGFISYQNGRDSLIFYFSYAQDRGLTTLRLKNTFLIDYQVAMQANGNIYIIYVHFNNVGLLKYNRNENILENINSQQINDNVSQNIVVDPAYTLFGYDKKEKTLYSFFIDYSKETLIINKQVLPNLTQKYDLKSFQRYRDILILTLQGYRQSAVIRLTKQPFMEEGVFQVDDIIQIPFQIGYCPIFIDFNIFVFYNNNNSIFQMINIKNQQIIFQQTLDQNHYVDINQYIDDQFIVNLTKNDDQGIVTSINQAVQLQTPSLIIVATNTKLQFTVYQVDRKYSSIVQILINVTNELQTTLTQNQIYIQNMVAYLTDNVYSIPLEKYIIGSNFNPQISVDENNFIKNISLNRVIQLQQSASVQVNNIENIYQTDGIISSIITNKSGNNYSIFAAAPEIEGQSGQVFLYTTSFKPSSPLGIIDNYGSFILQSDEGTESFTIYIPFIIRKTKLFYNSLTTTCSNTNFAFASDPQNNVLFVMCGQLIEQFNYQFYPDIVGQLLISSLKKLIFDSSQYQKLICIQGNLFIYNDLSIAAYDYFANSFVGNPIQIPYFQANQKVILFSQYFIISYYLQEKLTISLYSYNQFQSDQAVFVRNLIQGQLSSTNLSLIPKRNNIEYLYVSTGVENEYSLFRINNAYSQNQLYTTVTIASDKYNTPIISQDLICIIGSSQQVQCQQILKEATLNYQLNLIESNFYNNFAFNSLVTLNFVDQQQFYEIQVLRNGSYNQGSINESAESLQKLRTEIQDTNFSQGDIFYFNDQQLTNGCILGWNSSPQRSTGIINRLKVEESKNSISIFTILYNQKAILEYNQIIIGNNLLKIMRDTSQNCTTILDDSASRIQINTQSFSQNIYLICVERLYKYQIQFTQDNTGTISQAALLDQSFQSFDSHINSKQFKRIVSFQTELWLYNYFRNEKYQIVKIDGSDQIKIVSYNIVLTSTLSINIICSLNVYLQFLRSGLIYVQNVETDNNIQYSYFDLKDLLQKVNFIVGENDQIAVVNQYSDSKFRIQFINSFIYDITFSLDKNNQLIIQSASLYYYKVAFNYLALGISSNQYTLIVGFDFYWFTVALYDNQTGVQNQYIYYSASNIKNKDYDADYFYVTYAEQISQNKFVFYFSKGGSTSIEVSDSVGLVFLQNKGYYKQQIIIQPILNNNQFIFISINPDPISPSSQIRIIFSLSLFIIFNLIFN